MLNFQNLENDEKLVKTVIDSAVNLLVVKEKEIYLKMEEIIN